MTSLFVFYLIGLILAVFQDFKRREIDDWLNLFLFFSGVVFLFFSGNVFLNSAVYVEFVFFTFLACLVSFLLYNLRFFSGGDAKLLFAISPLFFNVIFFTSLINFFVFFVCLVLCGCIYSLTYAGILFFRDYKKTKKVFLLELGKKYSKIIFMIGVFMLFVGIFDFSFVFLGGLLCLFVILFSFAKSLDAVSMKKRISTKDLREGDWLFYDLKIGGKVFKKKWEGLLEKDVLFLNKFDKKVFIKDGIPYAPAFLMALILYHFNSYFIGIIFS